MLNTKALAEATAAVVKQHVDAAVRPLLARIEDLENRPAHEVKTFDDEKFSELAAELRTFVEERLAEIGEETKAAAIAAIPAPVEGKPGLSVTVDDVRPLIEAEVSKRVAEIPAAKDGIGAADAIIDRGGNLVLTMTDGTRRDLGVVVGKDADHAAIERVIGEKIAALPAPKDGADGLGFDDLAVTYDGERGFVLRFARGEHVKEFAFAVPVVIDRGVFREGSAYAKGDGVTYGGSFWIAQDDTSDKPDAGKGWRLAVKRGRDGKDATLKPEKAVTPLRVG